MGQSITMNSADLLLDDIENPEYLHHRKNFDELYDLGKEIGVGSFASVNKCYCKITNNEYAVKLIDKRYLTEKELIGLRDEIQILKKTDHLNIIKLYDVFDDGKTVKMVLEICDKNDLFDQIVASKDHHFDEKRAANIIYTIASALEYLHEQFIVHRDLKPENILFTKNGTLKITDFGLAHYESASSAALSASDLIVMSTCCGTPHYVAPEIITKNDYNNKCDTWSLGVITYIMLVGYQPFNASSLNHIYKLIAKGKYSFHSKRWDDVSDDAKHFVKCLLNIDPKKRFSAKQIKHHPWIQKYGQHIAQC